MSPKPALVNVLQGLLVLIPHTLHSAAIHAMRSSLLLMLAAAALPVSQGFAAGMLLPLAQSSSRAATRVAGRAPRAALGLRMEVESKDKPAVDTEKVDEEKDVKKFGLEFGVFKALTYPPCPRGSPCR